MIRPERPLESLSAFQRDLLAIVADNEGAIGSTLKDQVEEARREEITNGRHYRNLDELVHEGFVEKRKTEPSNSYYLTDEGRERLEDDLRWRQLRLEDQS